MEAGRELDARIAEVMGIELSEVKGKLFDAASGYYLLNYSTNIRDAMPVFDKMIEKVEVASIIRYAPKGREPYWEIEWRYRGARVREQTLELAICAFALAVTTPLP